MEYCQNIAHKCVCVCVCITRPDSLPYKSEMSAVPQSYVSEKVSLSSARGTSHARDSSPVTLQQKEMSQSASSAESASSLTKLGSV